MARPRQIRICREGIVYLIVVLAVLTGALVRQVNLLMLIGCVLVGPFVFNLLYGLIALRRFRIERKLPAYLQAEQRLMVDISVSNLRRWWNLWTIEVQDELRRERAGGIAAESSSVAVFFPRIAAGATAQVSYRGRLPERGRYHFGPLKVSTRFPVGLFCHTVIVERHETLLVHPKIGRLAQDWAEVIQENERGLQRMQRRGLLEADFFGLRDWRTGDSRRWIHWRTSARRGSLVVRQYDQRRSQDLAVLVDLWRPEHATAKELEHVESAVSFVATIIAESCRQAGRKLKLSIAAATPLHRSGAASAYFYREQMDSLALIEPHHGAFPLELGQVLASVSPATPALIISTRSIDWQALESAAAERGVAVADLRIRGIQIADGGLARYVRW